MANIKQVAELANLSISCVSKYLKEPNSVRPQSRTQIEYAINELNYTPSTIARNLRSKRTGIIKIISNSVTNQFFAELFETIRTELEKKEYLSSLFTIRYMENVQFTTKDFEQIDGVILCFIDNQKTLESIKKNVPKNLPVINIHGQKTIPEFTTIITDVKQGSYEATKYLIDQGSQHIAYVGGHSDSTISALKHTGFLSAIQNSSENITYSYSQNHEFSMQSGFEAATLLFSEDQTIDAIICENDLLAAGVIHFLYDSNKKIPYDVRVMGYDNIPLASMFIPTISSISVPIQEISELAVSKLSFLIEKKEIEDSFLIPTLLIRSST